MNDHEKGSLRRRSRLGPDKSPSPRVFEWATRQPALTAQPGPCEACPGTSDEHTSAAKSAAKKGGWLVPLSLEFFT